MRLTDVALACGYDSLSSFNAAVLNRLVNGVDQWANRWKPIDSDRE